MSLLFPVSSVPHPIISIEVPFALGQHAYARNEKRKEL